MNKPKFTEGPWSIDGDYITFTCITSGHGEVAHIQSCASPSDEDTANAHLIKTSPRLYAEIESDILEIKLNMSFIKFDDDALPILKDALARKETLLSEARGEKCTTC